MTEFAVVAPLMLFTLFGIMEGGLLMFGIGESRFAGGEVARFVAQAGTLTTADSDGIAKARNNTPIGSNSIVKVNAIYIYLVHIDGGNLVKDTDSCGGAACENSYRLDGSPIVPPNWPASSRGLSAYNGDWVGVDVNYTYQWKDGIIGSLYPAITQTATVRIRMEPWIY